MTRLVTRAALLAGIAIGASGLVALPAEAANGVATANYYVNNPAVGPASNLTPESALVTASIDTGGSPESLIPVSSAGLLWSGTADLTITGEQWNDGTAVALANSSAKAYAPIDGIPVSGSTSDVSVTVTDAKISNDGINDPGIGALSGVAQPISNAGADNYSDVTFEYDPVSDFVASGDTPGAQTQFAQDVQVPTSAGVSSVKTTLGAFGLSAQNNTGNTPLAANTKYYYWVVQQPGATDQATNVNVAAWTANATNGVEANNSYKCYPNVAIAADPTLESYVQPGATVNYGGQSLPASQGPCIYYYGNTGGALYYQSPNGEFTTPKLGSLTIGKTATVAGKKGTVAIADKSTYKASGTVQLTTKGGKVLAKGKFGLQPNKSGKITLTLTKAGVTAANKHQSGKLVLTSNWGQSSSTKSIKL
ncbi:MAG TPA: hypothetical protein VHV75_18180 [Solirubrobacteraceae bacterium]|nr:hypothetical protein [Solirubrobacteraceae bacterium]